MKRRDFMRITGLSLIGLSVAPLGCPSKTTIADFVSLIGKDAATLATFLGQSALAAQITSLASQIAIDITNWQSGSAATMAVEAIQALINLIATIPALGEYIPLVDLLLSALSGLLLLLPGGNGATLAHTVNGHVVLPFRYADAGVKTMTTAQKNFEVAWTTLTATAPLVK